MNATPQFSKINLAAARCVMDDCLASLAARCYTIRRLNQQTIGQFLDELAEPRRPPSRRLVLSEVRLLRWMQDDFQGRTTLDGAMRLMAARHYLQRLIEAGLLATNLIVNLKAAVKSRSWLAMVRAIQAKDTAGAAIHGKQEYHIDIERARRIMADLLHELQAKSRTG